MKDLAMHMMDIIENSITAGATEIRLDVFESMAGDYYRFSVRDNGSGMEPEFLQAAADPWTTTRTTRKFGLGLPLLQQNCDQAGGNLRIFSIPGKGTTVEASFAHAHIDRPPAGDIPLTLKLLIASYPHTHFIYKHHTDEGIYKLDTEEVRGCLEGASIQEPAILRYLQEMISENLKRIIPG